MYVTRGNLGAQLRELRQLRGLSQKDLGPLIGMSAAQLSQIETGAYAPNIGVIVEILSVLDARLELVLDEERSADDPTGSDKPPARPTSRRPQARGRPAARE